MGHSGNRVSLQGRFRYAGNIRKLRRLTPEQIPEFLFTQPPNTEHIRIDCECGQSYAPPWRNLMPHELGIFESTDGKFGVPSGIMLTCPKCFRSHHLKFPEVESVGIPLVLFCDESALWYGNRHGLLYCYASIGLLYDSDIEKANTYLEALKIKIQPDLCPSSWIFHAADLRSPDWRRENKVTADTPFVNEAIIEFLEKFSKLESAFKFVTMVPPFPASNLPNPKKATAYVRDYALTCMLYFTTFQITRRGLFLHHVIEAQYLDHNQNGIDYFVEKIARGIRRDLGYQWICHGQVVGLPITAPKGKDFRLEIADIFAYVVNRYFYKTNLGHESEFDLKKLGDVFWGVLIGHNFRIGFDRGFPWQYFFPDIVDPKAFHWEEMEFPKNASSFPG